MKVGGRRFREGYRCVFGFGSVGKLGVFGGRRYG